MKSEDVERVPLDTQWDETPRGAGSRMLRVSGWLIGALSVLGIMGYLVWQMTTDSESFRFEALIVFAFFLAIALIVLSALADRLKTRKNDPYRRVHK